MDKDLQAIQDVRDCMVRAKEASKVLRRMRQGEVDRIVKAMCIAGSRAAEPLARLAVEETGMGVVESKIAKNRVATDLLWDDLKDLQTVGVIERDDEKRVYAIADPMGPVAAVIPTTNPTSTALYKCIIALKSRNPIVVSPHPRAKKCIFESCRVVAEAAERAGAPKNSIQCLTKVTLEATQALMGHRLTGVVLATGGPDLVRAAYSSGNPALGVGSGNPPAIIDRTADVNLAARMIVASQTFDNGTICASEQSIVCHREVREEMLRELAGQSCHICSPDEVKKLEKLVLRGRRQNAAIVGQAPAKIASMAGFTVPDTTSVLICEYRGVGWDHPMSIEKLSPILAFYTVRDLDEAADIADQLLRFGGDGHSCSIHTKDDEAVMRLAEQLPAMRIMINAPTSQGSVGFATSLTPALTLGCGTPGKNIPSNNISALDLINRKRVAWVKPEVTDPAFNPDQYFAKIRESYGFGGAPSAGGRPGPVRTYMHEKERETPPPLSKAGEAAKIANLSAQDVKSILQRSFT